MDFRKGAKRALYYIRQGYGLASLPLVFFGYASSIYYLAIENVPFLHRFFPSFSSFLLLAGTTLPIGCGFLGYFYMKRSWFFREAAEISTEANPYSTIKVAPVMVPIYKLWYEFAVKEGYTDIANKMRVIIANSESTKKGKTPLRARPRKGDLVS